MTENERFGLVFAKTGSINSGTVETVAALAPNWQRQPFMLNLHIIKYKRKEVPYSSKNMFDMLRWNS